MLADVTSSIVVKRVDRDPTSRTIVLYSANPGVSMKLGDIRIAVRMVGLLS
jgi:hypothetical protein